jgi:hydrogenase expression/formation protein HypE
VHVLPIIITHKLKKRLLKMQGKIKMELNCPMPKFDFDVITLGHGSGGQLTSMLLENGVFQLLENDFLNNRHDGSIINLQGPLAFTTDSFVVSPISFPGGNIGDLAVNGTVNDLAMCGAIPKYLSLSFIIEEGFSMEEFWEVLISIKTACEKSGVQVITGDTKVVEKGKGDGIFINTTGIGQQHASANISSSSIRKGDKIIVSGPVASHGMAIMSVREGLEFTSTIKSDTQNLNFLVSSLLDEFGHDIHFLRDPTRGGISSVLSEIATHGHLGIELVNEKIPILTEVESACEILGLDPLYVANEGIFIAIVADHIAEKAVQNLRQFKGSSEASIMGEVVNDHPGQVILKTGLGGNRVLHLLPGDQLPRIC